MEAATTAKTGPECFMGMFGASLATKTPNPLLGADKI
jgi:hypothetical protein